MTLAQLGENALLARLLRGLPGSPDVLAGPGDDCAILGAPRAPRWQLLKTDCVVEHIHFLPEADPRHIGWKALCRAISDFAAMGGAPRHALITIAAPRDTPVKRLTGIYTGLRRAARRFGIAIVGGETSRSPGPLFLNVALAGDTLRTRCIRRSGGRPGHAIYVTGRLGGAGGGRHLTFTPRLVEGQWLAAHVRPSAMMDLSDGLGADLPRLATASRCGFLLETASLPRPRGVSIAQALGDGEDYELLLTVPASKSRSLERRWQRKFPRLPLTRIGILTDPAASAPPSAPTFDHFAPTR